MWCPLSALFLNFECLSCILTAWNSSFDSKAAVCTDYPIGSLFRVWLKYSFYLKRSYRMFWQEGHCWPSQVCTDFTQRKLGWFWGLQWEHGSLRCLKLWPLSLQTRSCGWAFYCNWNNLTLCDFSVMLYCSRHVLMFAWNVRTYLPHYTVTSHNSHVPFSTSYLPSNLLPPILRNVCHWARVPEDGDSTLLLKIHYSNSYFVCLQIGRAQGELRMISHCRGYVWSPTKSCAFRDSAQ